MLLFCHTLKCDPPWSFWLFIKRHLEKRREKNILHIAIAFLFDTSEIVATAAAAATLTVYYREIATTTTTTKIHLKWKL